jgi:hypothetical protein
VCKELQLEIRALVATRAPDDTYLLERQRVYKRRVKHLVRKHRAAVAIQKCQQWRTDRNAFWRSYKPKGATCPFPASKLAEHFKIKMNSWDQTATSPAPTDPQHNIDVTSTSAGLGEIVAALQRSSNTSAGIDGIPMALLKPHMPQLPDGDCSNSDAEEPPDAAAAITTIASMLQRLYSKVAGTCVVPAHSPRTN